MSATAMFIRTFCVLPPHLPLLSLFLPLSPPSSSHVSAPPLYLFNRVTQIRPGHGGTIQQGRASGGVFGLPSGAIDLAGDPTRGDEGGK